MIGREGVQFKGESKSLLGEPLVDIVPSVGGLNDRFAAAFWFSRDFVS